MPHNLYDWHHRIKAVEHKYHAVRSSVGHMQKSDRRGPESLAGATVGNLVTASENLEGTYLIRLWAEFETAVRSYYNWYTHDPETRIGTHDLINAVAGVRRGRAISEDVRRAVHGVRDYRNTLVHARDDPAQPIAIIAARHNLNTFLCKLPETRADRPTMRRSGTSLGASKAIERSPRSRQLVDQPIGVVDGSQRLDDRPRVDRDGPGDPVVVAEVEDERLDVAVEDQADDLVVAVDDRAARVAADDVGRRDEVERRVEVEPAGVARVEPALGKLVRRLVAVVLGMIERPADRGEGGDRLRCRSCIP